MTVYKKESHLRSLLKGISWRIIATIDTIIIVWIITCLNDSCSLQNAIEIGLVEFLFKFFIIGDFGIWNSVYTSRYFWSVSNYGKFHILHKFGGT